MPPSRHWILLAVAVAGTMQMLVSAIRTDSPGVKNSLALFGSPPPALLQRWQQVDRALLPAVAEQPGNIAADFALTQEANDPQLAARSLTYVRATYDLWPRRVYLCDPSNTLLFGDSVVAARLPTNPAWMKSHGIATRLHMDLREDFQHLQFVAERLDLP